MVGSKVNDKLKPVTTRRRVEVFISRLHPDTSAADVEQCTTDALMTDDDFNTGDVRIDIEQLRTKRDLYAICIVSCVSYSLFGLVCSYYRDSDVKFILARGYSGSSILSKA